ncbi:putative spermidine/putrescine transport system substrate-binding protein [Kribbella rubisoli]|uniref:Spermidine/putrescine transport system substrate-binding protein n=1 Tax=Kribbella rubisoli TaxID=3075929 RepID=A0A4Q7X5W7_9ACTN|nr:extracellular solute-binding protein [Kribbella rubisoli]RZU18474.1 putative spermidine/putrescine transport system substrate-binding protein [Kribbella rubisoli]
MKLRPAFGAVAAVVAATLALGGCAKSSTAAQGGGAGDVKTVRVFISGDTNIQKLWANDLGPAFEKANPGYKVQVTLDLHGEHDAQTMAKLSASVAQKKDPGFDVVDGGFVPKASTANLLEPADSSKISALADIPADVVKAGGTGGIPYRGSSVLLAYDTKAVPAPPKTLDDLLAWIKAHPGKFTYNSPKSGGSGGSFVATVLDKYVPADARQKMTVGYDKGLESNWDQGFATLHGLNPYVYQKGVYPNGNQQVLDLLANGQISMAPVWSDMFTTAVANGAIPATVKSTQISDPSFTGGAAYLGIPANSPSKDAALKLVNFVEQPEQQAMIVKDISGYPAISIDKLPQELQAKFANADTNNLRKGYFDSMTKDLNQLWDQKVPGK